MASLEPCLRPASSLGWAAGPVPVRHRNNAVPNGGSTFSRDCSGADAESGERRGEGRGATAAAKRPGPGVCHHAETLSGLAEILLNHFRQNCCLFGVEDCVERLSLWVPAGKNGISLTAMFWENLNNFRLF